MKLKNTVPARDEQGRLTVTVDAFLNIGESSYRFKSGRVVSVTLPGGLGEISATTSEDQINLCAALLNTKARDNGYLIDGGEPVITSTLRDMQKRIGLHHTEINRH